MARTLDLTPGDAGTQPEVASRTGGRLKTSMLIACAILLAGSLARATLAVQAAEDPVRVEGGLLSGTRGVDASIRVFKGIPFAAPPVGAHR